MTIETMVLWLFTGLIAGGLASFVVGGGLGLLGDIVVGVVGSFIGGFIFRSFGSGPGIGGLGGAIVVAFVGAVVLLLLLRTVHRPSPR